MMPIAFLIDNVRSDYLLASITLFFNRLEFL
jgi:hypothetical protein